MGPTNFAIKNPITVFILILLITIMGLSSYNELPRESSPDITIPNIIITTPYFGVSPSDIETLLTIPMEKKLKEISDIKELRSTSAESASMIIAEFSSDIDIDDALQKVREKVDLAKPDLPDDAEEPTITEINLAEFPIFMVTISGNISLTELKDIADDFKDEIEDIQGVLDVNISGGLEREIRIEIDPNKLKYYQLPFNSVINAIRLENINIPGGTIKVGDKQFLVRIPGEFENIYEIEDIVLKTPNSSPIYLKDVARVIDDFKEKTTISRINGEASVTISVQKRVGANIIEIVDEAKLRLKKFSDKYPENVKFTKTLDMSNDIRRMVSDLENNIITGLLLVLIVLFLFLGFRTAVFVAAAIPLSMLISFVVISGLGMTLNMVVLFSLILALGMLVDNAIVMVENIYRHQQEGKGRLEAAIIGAKEVGWPVITSTLTTLCAFGPMIAWPGIMGGFMGFLPKTLIITLTASLFVALIINPVLCSVFLNVKKGGKSQEEKDLENPFVKVYKSFLTYALKFRYLTVFGTFGILVLSIMAYSQLGNGVEFFPEIDPKRINININSPDGNNLNASDKISKEVESRLLSFKNISHFVANVGTGGSSGGFGPSSSGNTPNKSQITVDFLEKDDQVESSVKTMEDIRKKLEGIPGADIEVVKQKEGPASGLPVNIEISGDKFETLGIISSEIKEIIKEVPDLVNLNDNFSNGKPELKVVIDREKAKLLKLNTQSIASTIRTAFNGEKASVFREGDDEYDIVVRFPEEKRKSITDLQEMIINNADDDLIPLKEVADIEIANGLGSIRRLDQKRVVTVSADVQGRNANEVLKDVKEIIKEKYIVPDGYSIDFTGESEEQEEAAAFLSRAFIIALFMITMVLITQFNSIVLPTIILFSIILSLVGVLWGLIITQTPFGVIMTGIGVISLAGVVVNNAIVLIDYIQQLRQNGMEKNEAIIRAGLVRLRPVMLTAITTILGLIPMVADFSIDFRTLTITFGSESNQWWKAMAVAVVYGLAFSTLLTLVVVPSMYSILTSMSERTMKFFNRNKDESEKDNQEIKKEEDIIKVE